MSGRDHTTEQWLGLVEFPGYDISDRGQVRSYWKFLGYRYGQGLGDTPKLLKPITNMAGYLEVNIRHRSGKIRTRSIHRLVLEAFRGFKQAGQVCRHLNDVKTENNAENLEWGTSQENNIDKFRNGFVMPSGEDYSGPRFSDVAREAAKQLKSRGLTCKQIGERLRISPTSVARFTCKRHGPPTGQANPMSKLTDDDIREIRWMRSMGMRQHKIAARFGISRSLVSMITNRKLWSHIT